MGPAESERLRGDGGRMTDDAQVLERRLAGARLLELSDVPAEPRREAGLDRAGIDRREQTGRGAGGEAEIAEDQPAARERLLAPQIPGVGERGTGRVHGPGEDGVERLEPGGRHRQSPGIEVEAAHEAPTQHRVAVAPAPGGVVEERGVDTHVLAVASDVESRPARRFSQNASGESAPGTRIQPDDGDRLHHAVPATDASDGTKSRARVGLSVTSAPRRRRQTSPAESAAVMSETSLRGSRSRTATETV